jgi:hypothetical protein
MPRVFGRTLSPGTLISMVALFIALAGTAIALERNSVRSEHIVNGQVRLQDLAKSTRLGAVVRQSNTSDCTLIRGHGARGTSASAGETFCTVNFKRPIEDCVYVAGLTTNATGYPGADVAGEVWAFAADSDSISVRTANSAGTKNAQDFSIIVVC